jgi:hypothetical protein
MSKENIFKYLHQLNEIIDEIKEKVGDGLYMEIMSDMRNIYKKIADEGDEENIFAIPLRCNCSDNDFTCLSCIEHFNICEYKYEILKEVPFFAMILNERFDGQIHIPKLKLQMEPIRGEYICEKVFGIIKFLLSFHEKLYRKRNKIINVMCIYHYIFKNFKFLEDNERFKKIVCNKLHDFSNETLEEINLADFGVEENPFNIWLSHLKN